MTYGATIVAKNSKNVKAYQVSPERTNAQRNAAFAGISEKDTKVFAKIDPSDIFTEHSFQII